MKIRLNKKSRCRHLIEDSGKPKYQQIKEYIKKTINEKQLKAGDRFFLRMSWRTSSASAGIP
jgi:hypothetical protein